MVERQNGITPERLAAGARAALRAWWSPAFLLLAFACAVGANLDMALLAPAESSLAAEAMALALAFPADHLVEVIAEALAFSVLFCLARRLRHHANCRPPAVILALLAAFAFVFGPPLDLDGTVLLLFRGPAQIIKTVVKSASVFCVAAPFFLLLLVSMDWLHDFSAAPHARQGGADAANSGDGSGQCDRRGQRERCERGVRPARREHGDRCKRGAHRAHCERTDARCGDSRICRTVFRSIAAFGRRCAGLLDRHSFVVTAVVLLVTWMPYIVAAFPGAISIDSAGQLMQFYGKQDFTARYLPLMNDAIPLNQHHPVLHTLLFGGCVWLGDTLLSSQTIGVFLYGIVQKAVVLASFGFGMSMLARLRVPVWARAVVLAFLCLFPVYSTYAVFVTKDVIFSCAVLVLFLELYVLMTPRVRMRRLDWVLLGVVLFVVLFFRNGMLFVVVPTLLLAVLFKRSQAKRIIAVALPGIVSLLLVTSVVFPALDISPSGAREVLSIPIQQVARCVVKHGKSLTPEDKDAISGVISYRAAKRHYNPSLSDPVKNTYREKTITPQERSDFFKEWLSLLKRYPVTCAEATMANYYGALWFAKGDNMTQYGLDYALYCNERDIRPSGFLISPPIASKEKGPLYQVREGYLSVWENTPVLSLPSYAAFWMWGLLVLAAWSFKERRDSRCPCVLLLLIALLVLAGPCNPTWYLRYFLPLIFSLPFSIGFVFPGQREGEESEAASAS